MGEDEEIEYHGAFSDSNYEDSDYEVSNKRKQKDDKGIWRRALEKCLGYVVERDDG